MEAITTRAFPVSTRLAAANPTTHAWTPGDERGHHQKPYLNRSRNRIEAQFTTLRYFALDGTDHSSHKEQGSMIRRYTIWRNKHAADEHLRKVVNKANVA